MNSSPDYDPVAAVLEWGRKPEQELQQPYERRNGQPAAFDLDSFLARTAAKLGLSYTGPHSKGDGEEFRFSACPFQPDYRDGSAAVLRATSGALGFNCFCADHAPRAWKDLRELVDGPQIHNRATQAPEPKIRRIEDLPKLGSFPEEPMAFFVEKWIPKGAITTITGPAGSGKSTLILGIGIHSAHGGWGFGGRKVMAGAVLILDRENPRAIHDERKRRYAIEDVDDLHIWGWWCDEGPPDPACPIVLEWVQRHPTCLVIIDGLRAFLDGDENDSKVVAAFYQRLRLLTRLGATIIVIHHTGKADTAQKFRGSSAVIDQTDQLYVTENLSPDPTTLTHVCLTAEKTRFQTDWRLEMVWDEADHTWIRDRGTAGKRRSQNAVFEEILREHPGINGRQFDALVGERKASRDSGRAWLNLNELKGLIQVAKGEHNAKVYTWIGGLEAVE